MFTKEDIEKKIIQLRVNKEQFMANAFSCDGAIEVWREILALIETDVTKKAKK